MNKTVVLLIVCLLLGACGQRGVTGATGTPGMDGSNGQDGADGRDGEPGAILTEALVEDGRCQEVAPGIYVENIDGGLFFDVYYNALCEDARGEFCDNVEPSYGSTGNFGRNKPGGAEVCWAGNTMISGERVNDSLLIRLVEFQ